MTDQIIDAGAAQGLHAYADRAYPQVGWVVLQDLPAYSGKVVARLVTEGQTAFLLLGNTLAEIHNQLPPGLVCTGRQPSDPLELVEVWSAL